MLERQPAVLRDGVQHESATRFDASYGRQNCAELPSDERAAAEEQSGETFLMIDLLRDLWVFMRQRKKFWLAPIILVMVLFGALLIFAQGSVVAPFIYTLF